MVKCNDCQKKVKKGVYRCDNCALKNKQSLDFTKRIKPVGGLTLWRKPNGNYTPRP